MNTWTWERVEFLKDYLTLNGDLVLKSGQEAILLAINSIPEDLMQMEQWCDQWLDEKEKSHVLTNMMKLH